MENDCRKTKYENLQTRSKKYVQKVLSKTIDHDIKLYVIIHEFDFLLYIKCLIIFDALKQFEKLSEKRRSIILGFHFFFLE